LAGKDKKRKNRVEKYWKGKCSTEVKNMYNDGNVVKLQKRES
jgi:hypothetical protein